MKVQGVEISEAHQRAGEAAMKGEFTAHDVRAALTTAGFDAGRPQDYLLERVADRLMQRARKRGEVCAVNNRRWMGPPRRPA